MNNKLKMSFFENIDLWAESLLAGLPAEIAFFTRAVMYISIIILLCVMVNYLTKKLIVASVGVLVRKSSNKWDDVFLEKKVFHKLSHLAPVVVIYALAPALLNDFPRLTAITNSVTDLYIILMVLMLFYAFLNAVGAIYDSYDVSRTRPIKIYLQITKIITGLFAGIMALSVLLDKTPLYFLTGMGAAMAILMLVFKDTILGFVGGVQVTANNLVQVGDWIEMPKYGADGDVVEIALHTVKVQNWDRTITTIPTYALVTDSFKNWRGMVQSGGRRIKRSVFIDAKSVRFCDEAMLARFEEIAYLKDYIKSRRQEIEQYNKSHNFDPDVVVNGRRMTNLGTFRAYITHYLKNHPKIHQDMICMVRQLAPDEKGIPLEIYAFTNDIQWVNYEMIQSDLFDHILAVLPYFQLKVFQFPSELSLGPGIHTDFQAASRDVVQRS